ncbi:MAG: hypothetical protein DMF54_15675 [Acidobacteria bacterium]|nr:MAG: hypothetical protein DMF54_15675 [Acidobacteriota bacterium]
MVQGSSTSYTVTVAPSSTLNGAVQLTASGLPTGAGATFSPNPATTTSTMTVTTSLTTPTGSVIITVTGTNGILSHSATTNLVVSAAPQWVATYSVAGTPTSWGTNQTQTYSVTVTNAGSQTWPHTGGGLVDLGVHFTSAGGGFGNSTYYSDQRISLPADLAPGASVTLSITVTAPPNSGNLVLEYQMAKEGQFWFAQFADVNVTVS